MRARSILYVLLSLWCSSSALSQFFYFGRNKVEYTNFEWHVLKTEHFDIYYYPEMKELAGDGAFIAEESYAALEQKFNFNVTNRVPLILYSSHLHFQQTNTTPDFVSEGVGGFFEFLKGRVVIPYSGSMAEFHHVIRHELVHVFMNAKINRVLLDHRMALDRLPPLWFVEGLAEYWSTDWDVQAEFVLRDAVTNNYLAPLGDIEGIFGSFLMYKEGQAILQFVNDRYGEDKILFLMENFWKSESFEEVFKLTTGKSFKAFDEEWVYALKKRYLPLLASLDEPSAVTRPIATEGFNSKPVFYRNGRRSDIYYVGNHTGYTSIYRIPLRDHENRSELVVEGEKTSELEAFHLLQGNISISRDGVLAFVTKSGENDALHLFDTKQARITKTYRFTDIVGISSPSWSPDGTQLVFSAVGKSGLQDLYLWNTVDERLSRLTNDIYADRDPVWSPTGKYIVFSSDRTPFGEHGSYNLFLYDLQSHDIRYLTYGGDSYTSPEFSADGSALLFLCDIGNTQNVWMAKLDSLSVIHEMRRVTHFISAAFDPAWADSSLVLVAFEKSSFQIRSVENVFAAYDSSGDIRPVHIPFTQAAWVPRSVAGTTEEKSLRYTGEYSLDIAQSEISTDPVFGTQGGAFVALSDLLGNEEYDFLLFNTAQTSSEFLSSFNVAISRTSLGQRTNYAYGVYRFSGPRYDLTDPDEYFFERVFGGYFTLSYPLSKFERVGLLTSVSNSEKEATTSFAVGNPDQNNIDDSRHALFISNSLSFTHDNSLWGPSGPIDGSRFNVTLAYTSDVQYSNANYYSVIFDYRQYFRIADRSAYAVRLWLFYNEGTEARLFFMGGSWDLRGYDRWSLRGEKLWLVSNELRFPLIDILGLKFPFGGLAFSGIRGALFFDAGNAWNEQYTETLGSVGAGARLNLGGYLVLRYDIGKRIENNFHNFQTGLFNQFFFGWDF